MRAMRKEFAIATGGREVLVAIERHEDGTLGVELDGVARAVDARQLRPGTWSLVIDGASFTVDLDPRRNGVAASVGDAEALLVVEDAQTKRLRSATQRGPAARGEEIKAPIAGKLVKLLCAVGDEIAAGQAVAVLEAMKMENEIVAERGGTVSEVARAPGQSVETGERLLVLV
jgi:biotin carboxyl carrier protein